MASRWPEDGGGTHRQGPRTCRDISRGGGGTGDLGAGPRVGKRVTRPGNRGRWPTWGAWPWVLVKNWSFLPI